MQVTFTSELIQAVATSLERDRPEIFSAYTSDYKAQIGSPWNKNLAAAHSVSQFDGTEIHYAASIQQVKAGIDHKDVFVEGTLGARFRKKRTGSTEDRLVSSSIRCTISFADPSNKGSHYRLRYDQLDLAAMLPVPLRNVVSWYVTNQLNDSTESNSGIPKELRPKDLGIISIAPPSIANGKLILKATLS